MYFFMNGAWVGEGGGGQEINFLANVYYTGSKGQVTEVKVSMTISKTIEL
jgi:hypothetical protein